jgi:hypothetical protein
MDYAVDLFTDNDNDNDTEHSIFGPQFVYDDPRYFSKIYILLKTIGFVVYTSTLTMCSRPELYISMIGVMGLSVLNSARYEYRHHQRYMTTFSSIVEYDIWKRAQWPKSRVVFTITELGIKIAVFITTFPPRFEFFTICQVAQSILHIHILILFIMYAIAGICALCVLSAIYCCNESVHRPHRRRQIVTLPLLTVVNDYQNEECCICLDKDTIQIWAVLPCGHKFHSSCIMRWLVAHPTCPVCRVSIR